METKRKQKAAVCCPTSISKNRITKPLTEKKRFVKASIPALFHIPFQKMIGKKITKMMGNY